MKATEQYFPVVLFIMLYKVVLTYESVVELIIFFSDISAKINFYKNSKTAPYLNNSKFE